MVENSARDESARRDARDEAPTGSAASVEHRAPVVPDNGYSRESYAIHATRTELPLFSNALHGSRDDARWLSSLSGVLGSGDPEAAASAAQAAIERRRRRADDSDA
jgi:hypothetical protein